MKNLNKNEIDSVVGGSCSYTCDVYKNGQKAFSVIVEGYQGATQLSQYEVGMIIQSVDETEAELKAGFGEGNVKCYPSKTCNIPEIKYLLENV